MSVINAPRSAPDLAAQLHRDGANVVAIRPGEKAPIHKWKRFTRERQSEQEVHSLPWNEADRVGIINGVGGIRSFDFDGCPTIEPVETLLAALELPTGYSWGERSGSGRGFHIWVRCTDDLPPGILASGGNEPGVFIGESKDGSFHHLELRWERNQTIIASSDGRDRWLNGPPTEPPALVPLENVVRAFRAVAHREDPPPPALAPVHERVYHQDDRSAIEAVKERFDVAEYATMRFPGDVQQEADGQLRVRGKGGLLIDPRRNVWYRFTGDIGGDAIDLVGMARYGEAWDRRSRMMFPDALREAAEFAGVNLADYRHTPAPPRAPIPIRPAFGDMPPDELRPDAEEHPPFQSRPLTDFGNAERLVMQHGRDLRYCHVSKVWHVWDARRWAVDYTAEVIRRMKSTVRTIYHEAGDAATDAERAALAKHAIRSEGEARISAALSLAESEPGVPVLPDQLDADPWLFNVLNGTINLRDGKLYPHRRADLITKLAPVTYDPDATCQTWEGFLARIIPSEQTRRFLQRVAGYTITGDTREDVLLIAWGIGSNGKTTLIDTLLALTGEYGMTTPIETLMMRRNEGVRDDIADLKGARMVAAAEGNEGQRLAEGLVKQMTGGDRIKARHLYGRYFEYDPQFALWVSTNHRPRITGTDRGIWRRIRLVPFNVVIPDEEQDKELKTKLLAELPGILNWALTGCLDWQRHGLGMPDEVKEATEAYREEMDAIGAWLSDRCVKGERMIVRAGDLYVSYRQWCEENGEQPMSQTKLAARLKERDLTNDHDRKGTFWTGIGLVDVTGVTGRDLLSEKYAREEEIRGKTPQSHHNSSHPSHVHDDDFQPGVFDAGTGLIR